MEPFKNSRGEQAALRAATQSSIMSPDPNVRQSGPLNVNQQNRNACFRCLNTCCMFLCMPILWLFDCFLYLMGEYVCRCCNRFYQATKRQAKLCLNGKKPWMCSVRLTSVNVVVACSTWYMFSDQARLAFFPSNADDALARVNFVVFCILMTELLFEVFIRPDGYQDLIISDKAYAPTTVRFINFFHLIVESVSLLCFIPEFYCMFSPTMRCDEKLNFSFFNAALMGVVGPTSLDSFYGKAYFALIRFRVFGLVRHWKKMWINNTFINMRWKAAHGFFSGSTKQVTPLKDKLRNQHHHHSHKAKKEETEEGKKKESVLTNASNIGTALMVTNSYRVLIMLCAIVGIFPALASISNKTTVNKTSTEMTEQLQATNLLVTDNSFASCGFQIDSVASWVLSLTPSEDWSLLSANTNTFLLSLSISPNYCLQAFDVVADQNQTESSSNSYILQGVCEVLRENYNETADVLVDAVELLAPQIERPNNAAYTRSFLEKHCKVWDLTGGLSTAEEIADTTDLRAGAVTVVESTQVMGNYTIFTASGNSSGNSSLSSVEETNVTFSVTAVFNETYAIESS